MRKELKEVDVCASLYATRLENSLKWSILYKILYIYNIHIKNIKYLMDKMIQSHLFCQQVGAPCYEYA